MPAYHFSNFPLVIEPLTTRLELKASIDEEGEGTATQWHVFHRLAPEVARAGTLGPLPDSLVHFFGDAPLLGHCRLILVYDTAGVLTMSLKRQEDVGAFEQCHMPEEVTGRVPRFPSLRIVFPKQEDYDAFMKYLMDVADGHESHPRLAELLAPASNIYEVDVGVTS